MPTKLLALNIYLGNSFIIQSFIFRDRSYSVTEAECQWCDHNSPIHYSLKLLGTNDPPASVS